MDHSPGTPVIVTGAASGIGRACARALAQSGRPVALWDIQMQQVEEAAAEISASCTTKTCSIAIDLLKAQDYADAVARSRAAIGPPGGLVHAAGVAPATPVENLEPASWDTVLNLNLRAQALLVSALLEDLRRQPGASVVGIASVDGLIGHAAIPAYCSSKAGLLGLTRSLADQLAEDGIRVNAVCPGYIDTPMLAPALEEAATRQRFLQQIPLGRFGRPEEIARVVRFLMSDEAAYITGTHLTVDGGLLATLR